MVGEEEREMTKRIDITPAPEPLEAYPINVSHQLKASRHLSR